MTDVERSVRVRDHVRLMVFILIGNLGIYAFAVAVPGYLLPASVQDIVGTGATTSAANLALITMVGSFAAMIAQPVAGLVSDRTRSRFGRRAPYLLGGALVGGVAMIGLGSANSILLLTVFWTVVQISYSFTQAPLAAVLPDRVPESIRGTFSTFAGLGLSIGATGGAVVGAGFVSNTAAGYLTFGGIVLVGVVLFVVFNPDRSSKGEPREPFSSSTLLRTFWINPARYPDFAWAFLGRMLLSLAYFMVTGYQLYILEHYIHVGSLDEAASVAARLSIVTVIATIIGGAVAGPISDRIKRRRLPAVAAGVIYTLGLAVPLVMPNVTGMTIYSFLYGLGFGSYASTDMALMSEVLPSKEEHGRALGLLNVAVALPQALGAGLAGLLVITTGSYTVLFPVGIVIALAGSFAVIRIKSVR